MGDAAHLAVPFTSAGVTNALFDADQLALAMEEFPDNMNKAFERFYQKRITDVSDHLQLGRKLKSDFLHPQQIDDDHIELPLIKKSLLPKPSVERKDIQIVYFTDPICSTCWTIQPQLRKLRATYGSSIDFRYVMAGLLPSWKNFNRWGITSPSDVYHHWNDEADKSGMPIDPTIWIKDPLESSYSPSIAFKAAQLQDIDKAILMLRRLNELIFMESDNITKAEVIKRAAYDVGLDAARLMRDFNKNAVMMFQEDLRLTTEMGINLLPTFIFKVNNEIKEYLVGAQTYESFEKVILGLNPMIVKKDLRLTAIEVFNKYPSLTKKEFKFLTNTNDAEADLILSELLSKGAVRELVTPNGHILITKNEASLIFHPQYAANLKTG